MLNLSIGISRETVKALGELLRQAYRAGDAKLVKRASALLRLSRKEPADSIADELGCSVSSLYAWFKMLVYEGVSGLKVNWRGGRPSRLSKQQKAQLVELLKAGPKAAGFQSGCWNAAMIQHLIEREFGVLYNVHYVAELLSNLGFSFQADQRLAELSGSSQSRRWPSVVWG